MIHILSTAVKLSVPSHILAMSILCIILLVLFLLPDTKSAPMTSEQVMEKPEETVSDADTSYETGSVVSTSNLSQITKVRHRKC